LLQPKNAKGQFEGNVFCDASGGAPSSIIGAPWKNNQHQLGTRRTSVSAFCLVLREQRRNQNADARAGHRTGPEQDHHQLNCARSDRSPINAKLLNDPAKLKELLENIPLGRLGKSEDVAGIASASEDSDYFTGTTIFVDGGLLCNHQEQ
jgi:hypothetical protein